jgi:hypothetical protein
MRAGFTATVPGTGTLAAVGDPASESEGSDGTFAQMARVVASRPGPGRNGGAGAATDGIALQPLLEIGDRSAVGTRHCGGRAAAGATRWRTLPVRSSSSPS